MTSDAAAAVLQLSAAIDEVLAVDLDGLADSEVLELVGSVEREMRRGATVDHGWWPRSIGVVWRTGAGVLRRRC